MNQSKKNSQRLYATCKNNPWNLIPELYQILVFYLIISKSHWNSTSHKSSPPYYDLQYQQRDITRGHMIWRTFTVTNRLLAHTCWLKLILSSGDFFIKLDKNDRGKTNAALPTKTRPNSMELTWTDNCGLQIELKHKTINHASLFPLTYNQNSKWSTSMISKFTCRLQISTSQCPKHPYQHKGIWIFQQ